MKSLFAALLLLAGVVWMNSVPVDLSTSDRRTFDSLFAAQHLPTATFDQQIDAIKAVKLTLARAAPNLTEIPEYQSREPADIVRLHEGICYDRSRFVEKALTYLGLEARHVSIYEKRPEDWTIATLSERIGHSHALSEVRTARGWMLVDSNDDWFGLTADGQAVSADMIARNTKWIYSTWDVRVKGRPNVILENGFVRVVGLYARHGSFFWPYLPVPNVNFSQLSQWLLGA